MTITVSEPSHLQGRTYAEPYTPDMANRKIRGVEDARKSFAAVLNDAVKGLHTILLRRNKPVAVVVPPEWYYRAAEAIGDPWEFWSPPEED